MMDLYGRAGVSVDKEVQIKMLYMLKRLSLQRDDVRAAIVQHRVPSSIFQMLLVHPGDMWNIASAVIARMVTKEDICGAFLDLGTPGKLVQILDNDHLRSRLDSTVDDYPHANVMAALHAFSRYDTAREYMLSVSFLWAVKQILDASHWKLNKIALEIFDLVIQHDDDLSSLRQLNIIPRLEALYRYPLRNCYNA
ncbi:hypothetical protein SCP_1004940 [Sparassis crispa]|uniref:ARM repeat-containing protein n=1 Tax=Sparassis crispa TaxID=139825 RepID=A0A401GYK5_9APHY|nr:hypothetical protein SCP_1004940 [Sparassis crispa]GBE87247.1 hypothetical protein SCP_1004940 [Sparassis crispa]